jgi:hypothetical protein
VTGPPIMKVTAVSRPKHQKPWLEAILRDAEDRGWIVTKGKRYYKMRCSCGSHQKTVKLSPSDANYGRNLIGWLKRSGCWGEGGNQT